MALLTAGVLVALAWGTLAFGAVYPWAYWPLLAVCAATGLIGCGTGRGIGRLNKPLLVGLCTVGAAVSIQLIPLSGRTLESVSPSTETFLTRYDLSYAFNSASERADVLSCDHSIPDTPPTHPLSIQADSTRRSLLFLGSLGVLLVGTAAGLSAPNVDATLLVRGIVAVGAIVGFAGIVQRALFGATIYGFWQPRFQGAVFGPFVNRNHFAGWMMMAAPLAIGYLCALIDRERRGVKRGWRDALLWFASPAANRVVFVALAILIMSVSIVLTRSRSGAVCFTISLLAMAWLAYRGGRASPHGRAVAAFLVLLPVAVIVGVGPDIALNRFMDPYDAGLTGRIALWRDTGRIIRDFPLTGTGLNTYGTTMLLYATVDPLHQYFAAHNDYLQLAAEGGVLVGLPAALLVGLFAYEVRRRFRDGGDTRTTYWLRVGATTGVVAIALQALVEFSLEIPANAALFAMLCAIAVHRPAVDRSTVAYRAREA